jgi:lipopolysaccharide/colanic/teichoic acid biosynthesis glycosyltransferase
MSPRPPIPYEVAEYDLWHTGRFDSAPGITGLWQVSGKNQLSFTEMVRLDVQYARRRSFWLDMWILLQTPRVVVSQLRDKLAERRNGKP